jgi:hypothetical protein
MEEYAVLGYSPRYGRDWYVHGGLKISVRGFIKKEGAPPAALIEVEDEGTFVVRKDDRISLQRGANTINLDIQKISGSSVIVKILPLDRTMPFR